MRRSLIFVLGLALTFAIACGSPSEPDTPTRTPAAPTVNESFIGTVKVGGFAFYSFSIAQYGTVNVTLNAISGSDLPEGATLNVGIGKPEGVDCAASTSTAATPGTTAQLTANFEPGVYCSKVTDNGILVAPATFDVTIAHP